MRLLTIDFHTGYHLRHLYYNFGSGDVLLRLYVIVGCNLARNSYSSLMANINILKSVLKGILGIFLLISCAII